MSLLLQALQNAAKNREASGTPNEPGSASQPNENPGGELTLEPMTQGGAQSTPGAYAQSTARTSQPRTASSQSAPSIDEIGAEPATRSASPQQAQTVLRAGVPGPARPNVFAWISQRPLVAFSTAAGLFAIGYGTYLYLQLTNPGIFASRPPASSVPPPSPTAQPLAPPPVPPAPVAGPSPAAPPAMTADAGRIAPPISALPNPTQATGVAPPLNPNAAPAAAPDRLPGSTAAVTGSPPPSAPAAAQQAPAPSVATAPPLTAAAPPRGPAMSVAPTQSSEALPPAAKTRPAAPVAGTRPAPKPASADGIAPNTAGQIVPVSASLASAHQALEKGQLDEAERMYRQTLTTEPRSTDAMLGLAATMTQQNRADAASQLYMRVLEQEPRNAYAQAGLLNLAGRADPAAAEARLKQLIARDPSPFLFFSLGNLYAEQGQWAGAQAAYFQAHTLAPDNPDYAFNLAVGLEHLSQSKLALNYYRRAVSLAQSKGHSQFDSAKVQARIRSLETALADRP